MILHDLVLLPAYSALDRAGARRAAAARSTTCACRAGLSLLMLLVFWGTIRGKGAGAYARVSGLEYDGYVHALAARHRGAVRDLAARSTCCAAAGPELASLAP